MLYAKPWQQLAICGVFILTGVVLIIYLGHPAGVVLIVFGIGAGARIVAQRLRGRRLRRR